MIKKIAYAAMVLAGLLGAVFLGLSLKYSPDAVLLASALAADAVYERLFVNSPEEDARHISLAVAQKDIRLCRKVSDRYVHSVMPRQTCYREVVKAVSDPGICGNAEIAEYIGEEHCYAILAAATGDASFCERIGGEALSTRSDCYEGLALKKNDPGFCLKVPEEHRREYCRERCAAKKKYDESPDPRPGAPGRG
ncbi:MAG: hypothetical protein AB7V08_09210 [Elusimicrobiales bacterium]